jgi:hypothetical protein
VTHGQVLLGGKNGFAVWDARTGRSVPWRKRLNGVATTFAVSGGTVYLGANPVPGGFTEAGGKPARDLASVILPTGRFTNWRPKVDTYVDAIAVSGGTVLVS